MRKKNKGLSKMQRQIILFTVGNGGKSSRVEIMRECYGPPPYSNAKHVATLRSIDRIIARGLAEYNDWGGITIDNG